MKTLNHELEYYEKDTLVIKKSSKEFYKAGSYRGDYTWAKWSDGGEAYCDGQKRHRLDGPAWISAYGDKEWWYHDQRIECSTQEEFEKLIKLRHFW